MLTYKRYEMILDSISYALIFSVLLMSSIVQGDIFLNIYRILHLRTSLIILISGYRFADFLFIFLSNLSVIYIIFGINKLLKIATKFIKNQEPKEIILILVGSIIFALVIIAYTYSFFGTPGGWIVSGRPGILGPLGSFWLDFIAYFILALLARLLFFIKKNLHRYFNTSIALFLISLIFFAFNYV